MLGRILLACVWATAAGEQACSSSIEGDAVGSTHCYGWCDPVQAADHCKWCKARVSPAWRPARAMLTHSFCATVPRLRMVRRSARWLDAWRGCGILAAAGSGQGRRWQLRGFGGRAGSA